MGQVLLEKLRVITQTKLDGSEAIEMSKLNCWSKIMVAFCVASAVQVASVSAQIESQLPPIFQFFSLAILFAVASFFVSEFIDSARFPHTARVLERIGVFFAVTGVFIALTIPFPRELWLKVTIWVVYVISLAVVLVSSYFGRSSLSPSPVNICTQV
ncbi:hypothetical protein PanWU01x14_143190 [Parasponia andersonii]|uniref:Uncharacterized protein n=1 Tax=Parasponia andersonii TaxID=3476 RepID=A0A2P5CKT2_PARAD|nr:hypothetical protein PanWU01x14_143190 [Parasponia andersonii]